jgi:sugar lactone lactonase YvrE
MNKLLLTCILFMSILVALTGCGGGNGSPTAPIVSTLAGTAGLSGSTDGTGMTARFNEPMGIAVDGDGSLYITDTNNHTIRKLTKSGPGYIVTTIAGSAGNSGTADGTGTAARFNYPIGIAADGDGNLYVTDIENQTIRKLTKSGSSYTVDTITSPVFNNHQGIAVDSDGVIYVADSNHHTIRKLTKSGSVYTVTTIAGSGFPGYGDGTGTMASFDTPEGIAVDGSGNLYVADTANNTIRKLTKSGSDYIVTTIAGLAPNPGSSDGTGTAARFRSPRGITVDSSGNCIYVADCNNNTIRKLTKSGSGYIVTTVAGSAGLDGSADGTSTAARFNGPYGITIDGNGNLFVADDGNNTIRKITF